MADLFPEQVPDEIISGISLAHSSWHKALREGLAAMSEANPAYLAELAREHYLPTQGRLFAAFSQPVENVQYVLVGEGPYPRELSATGVCFMDGAVTDLWSDQGLSKQVNRATSLRNFMKMLLVADSKLQIGKASGDALKDIALEARQQDSALIQTLPELQENLLSRGFLLLNASLVYREHIPPLKEAKAWQPLISMVLETLVSHVNLKGRPLPTLVLWGKVAEQLRLLPQYDRLPKAISEHPYNLTFIANPVMQSLFEPMHLLQSKPKAVQKNYIRQAKA